MLLPRILRQVKIDAELAAGFQQVLLGARWNRTVLKWKTVGCACRDRREDRAVESCRFIRPVERDIGQEARIVGVGPHGHLAEMSEMTAGGEERLDRCAA